MTELSPARIRDAAEVVEAVNRATNSHPFRVSQIGPSGLRAYADSLERAQAAEAEREKRVEELVDELIRAFVGPIPPLEELRQIAEHLYARYPALAEGPVKP